MIYDFDKVVDRHNTYSMKYDGLKQINDKTNGDSIPLFVADMDFQTARPILDALHKTVDFGILGYTMDRAEPRYAQAVCHWWKQQYDLDILPEHIVYSNGTVEAIRYAIEAFSNIGDGVIIQRPVYGHFTSTIEEECFRRVVNNQLLCKDGYYTIDYNDLEEKCADPDNRILIFCSPANPVGRVWTPEEIQKVAAIAKKYHVLLISDEVHCDILRSGVRHYPIFSVVEDTGGIIMCTAINKTFNLAGLQCSNIIIPDAFLRSRFKKSFGRRQPTPFAISACIAAYNEGVDWMDQMNAYIDGNIRFAMEFLKENMPWVRVREPEGTYCLWLDFKAAGLSDAEVHRRIYEDANVILQDGTVHDPDLGGCFQRICVPCARSVLKEALTRIAGQFQDIR